MTKSAERIDLSEWRRIDGIRSVSSMKKSIADLEPGVRRAVILHGLRSSRFQFTWSWLAEKFGVPRAEWPSQEAER